MTSYRLLQGLTGVLALIPILTGAITMMGVHDPLYAALDLPGNPLLDSNLRFLGGVGLGLTIARTLAEKNGATVRLRNHPEGGVEASVHFPARP